jgi:hypothetical protein
MASYVGGMRVGGGYYWNPRTWEVHVVGAEGGTLPGSERAHFARIPFPLLFVVVPLLGALFLVFLPIIGFWLVGQAIFKKVVGGVKSGAEELAVNVTPARRSRRTARRSPPPSSTSCRRRSTRSGSNPVCLLTLPSPPVGERVLRR